MTATVCQPSSLQPQLGIAVPASGRSKRTPAMTRCRLNYLNNVHITRINNAKEIQTNIRAETKVRPIPKAKKVCRN
ncbi:unnamed protein product [Parnassius mnemosyne]|uniref:Ribosomal protein L28 n=1 Tax=Parnassius mnemosyne TaxID=213953 RepID=A0AAV1KKM6_9NEOP